MIALGLHEIEDGPRTEPDLSGIASRLRNIFGVRFEVLHPIAIGGMAILFLLRHRLHHGLFVAKVLHPQLAVKPGVLRSFRAEAVHAAQLGNHPNAVPVLDFGEMDGLFFMTMPYIEGEDLDKLLERSGPFSREETLNFAAQLGSLLSFAETRKIVHCDLTPANIRLDIFGFYRLLDFGISCSEAYVRESHFTGGTPLYTSPEQRRGETPDQRSDLYSLGAILAEMLTGKPLFHAETLDAIDQRHREGRWEVPEVLQGDESLIRLLTKLLATKPEDRFQSSFELSGALAGLGFSRPEFREQSNTAGAFSPPGKSKRSGRLSSD